MDLIIFDLDGTLVDSRRDIATSVNELRAELGQAALPAERIFSYIGDGVRALLERSIEGALPEEIDRALEIFLPIYRRHLLDSTRPYPGVAEGLEALNRGRTLAVLTNKPQRESVAVLEGLGLAKHFTLIYGGESFPRRKPDPMGVHALLEQTGTRRERALMVGDSRVDVETARNAGIPICLVSYGQGAGEIEELRPDHLIHDLRELLTWLEPV